MKKTTLLRTMLARPGPVVLCGVHDGLSAHLAEQAGFHALWASGFCISASKRMPDTGLVTMTEHLAAASEINKATALPVVADVDDGFGDAVNVTRMVREYEAAGIAAICMEDNRHPKRSSLVTGLQRGLVSAESFASKVLAAKETRSDDDFVVIARTEALVAGLGLAEALHRAAAYARAGADLLLIHSKDPTPGPIKEFASQWGLQVPLVAVPTTYPDVTIAELYDCGYKMTIFANQGLRAQIASMESVFHHLMATGTPASVEKQIAPLHKVFSLVGYDEIYRIESRFMRPLASGAAAREHGKNRHGGE